MKKFFKEFGDFIKRGNVLDMAVGVIIGGAFTAIVTALSTGILTPVINWVLASIMGGENPLEAAYTILKASYLVDAETGLYVLNEAGEMVIDLANSIYIDWGAFISAIINFILVALVIFIIVRSINKVANEANYNKQMHDAVLAKMQKNEELNKVEQKWVARMKKKHPEMVPVLETPAEEPAPAPAPEPTATEKLLQEILEQLKAQK